MSQGRTEVIRYGTFFFAFPATPLAEQKVPVIRVVDFAVTLFFSSDKEQKLENRKKRREIDSQALQ